MLHAARLIPVVAALTVTSDAVWAPQLAVPSDAALIEQIDDALDFRLREDHDVMLDAWEPGELLNHASLTQGLLDADTYGLDALFVVGDELFEYAFRPEDGLGNGLHGPPPNMRRVHAGEFGGPDAYACSSCHFLGGPDGAGTQTQNAFFRSDGDSTLGADERNPPHLLGLGPVAALAQEMTRELQALRDHARATGETVALVSKGIDFGTITGDDDAGIVGVDPDLVIRPFGWKGHRATLFGIVEESFRIHLGIVSTGLQAAIRDGLAPDAFGDGPWHDVDRDGVSVEVDDAMLTTVVAYLAQLEVPIVRPPQTPDLQAAFAVGQARFDAVGCATCHVPALTLYDTVLEAGRDNPITIDVAHDGESPKPEPTDASNGIVRVRLFSDLKRHDMGPELATPAGQSNIPASHFLTRPLWGLADTAPYLHDGRAPTVHDAIIMHGGAASAARDAYRALPADEQGAIGVYLLSLTRAPAVHVP